MAASHFLLALTERWRNIPYHCQALSSLGLRFIDCLPLTSFNSGLQLIICISQLEFYDCSRTICDKEINTTSLQEPNRVHIFLKFSIASSVSQDLWRSPQDPLTGSTKLKLFDRFLRDLPNFKTLSVFSLFLFVKNTGFFPQNLFYVNI